MPPSAIIGLAVAGVAAAWLWQIDWILVLSLVIGGEELLESTLHIQALSMAERNQSKLGRSKSRLPRGESLRPAVAPAIVSGSGTGLAAELVWAGPRRRAGSLVVGR